MSNDKETLEKAVRDMQSFNRRLVINLTISGGLAYSVWTDFYSALHKNKNLYRHNVKSVAKDIDEWFWSSEHKWSKSFRNNHGFVCTIIDVFYDSLKEDHRKLHQLFESNYKEATMSDYELLGWMQMAYVFIMRGYMYYDMSMKNVTDAYGKAFSNGYNEFCFKDCWLKFNKLYELIWNQVGKNHTAEHAEINNNSPECQSCMTHINQTLVDAGWVSNRLNNVRMIYEANMYGYGDLK